MQDETSTEDKDTNDKEVDNAAPEANDKVESESQKSERASVENLRVLENIDVRLTVEVGNAEGPYVVIDENTSIGDYTMIGASCHIRENCKIGNNIVPIDNLRQKFLYKNN